MSRQPIYAKGRQSRVVSMPNGFWQYQELGSGGSSKEVDPWVNVGRAATQANALTRMPKEGNR